MTNKSVCEELLILYIYIYKKLCLDIFWDFDDDVCFCEVYMYHGQLTTKASHIPYLINKLNSTIGCYQSNELNKINNNKKKPASKTTANTIA